MILTFAGMIHSRVGQPRAGDRHLNVTISASQVPLPVAVAVKGALGVIRAARLSPAQASGPPVRQATGRTGIRPATGHNKGSFAQVAVTG
jgi:hypothetical protein